MATKATASVKDLLMASKEALSLPEQTLKFFGYTKEQIAQLSNPSFWEDPEKEQTNKNNTPLNEGDTSLADIATKLATDLKNINPDFSKALLDATKWTGKKITRELKIQYALNLFQTKPSSFIKKNYFKQFDHDTQSLAELFSKTTNNTFQERKDKWELIELPEIAQVSKEICNLNNIYHKLDISYIISARNLIKQQVSEAKALPKTLDDITNLEEFEEHMNTAMSLAIPKEYKDAFFSAQQKNPEFRWSGDPQQIQWSTNTKSFWIPLIALWEYKEEQDCVTKQKLAQEAFQLAIMWKSKNVFDELSAEKLPQ